MLNFFRRLKPVTELSTKQTMRIYSGTGYGKGVIFVAPGVDHPDIAEFIEEIGYVKKPRMFTVRFTDGVAEVIEALGEYIVRQGLASRTPVAIPLSPEAQARAEVAEPPRYSKPIPVGRPLKEMQDLIGRDPA